MPRSTPIDEDVLRSLYQNFAKAIGVNVDVEILDKITETQFSVLLAENDAVRQLRRKARERTGVNVN